MSLLCNRKMSFVYIMSISRDLIFNRIKLQQATSQDSSEVGIENGENRHYDVVIVQDASLRNYLLSILNLLFCHCFVTSH